MNIFLSAVSHEIKVDTKYGSLISVGLSQMKVYAKYKASVPCSY